MFYKGYAQGNIFPPAPGKVGIGTNPMPMAQRPLHINAYPNTVPNSHQDATMRLSFATTGVTAATAGNELSWGHLSLISPEIGPPIIRQYSELASASTLFMFPLPEGEHPIGDIVLSASDHAHHLILATRNPTGHIQLSTTSVFGGPDVARMIINPNGDIFLGKQACNIAATNDPTILFSNYYNNYDVIIGSKLGVGNPAGGSTSCTGTAGSITFFGDAGQSFDVIHNLDGHFRFGTGLIGSNVVDFMSIAPWTGRIGVGYNLNADDRIPGPNNELSANFLVSQTNHTYPNGFGMDGIVMRVERRIPSLPPVTPYALISAGDGANVESFSVLWDGTIKSTTLAGTGVRPVFADANGSLTSNTSLAGIGVRLLYADANGNLTTNGTPPAGWNLTGNAGTSPSTDFIGTTDAQSLILKTNSIQRLSISSTGETNIFANSATNPTLKVLNSGEVQFLGNGTSTLMTLKQEGDIGIGTSSPQRKLHVVGDVQVGTKWDEVTANLNRTTYPYLLSVNGAVVAKSVQVTAINWADFVLSATYNLPPLEEVAVFIKENGHLPGIPSESEVRKDGIDVAEMQAKLLQKIEELTLYVIELKKQSDRLQEEITNRR